MSYHFVVDIEQATSKQQARLLFVYHLFKVENLSRREAGNFAGNFAGK